MPTANPSAQRIGITGLLLFLLVHVSYSQTSNKTDWNADINFLSSELSQKHHNFFTVKSKSEFQANLEKIKATSQQFTDFENAVRLQQLIASFGDSHTKINFGQLVDKSKVLPVQVYWFSDGLFILQATQEHAEIVGHQILSLNGVPFKTIADSLTTLVTIDNQAMVKLAVKELFPLIQLHRYFGFASGDEIELELKDLQGQVKQYSLRPAELNKQNRVWFKPDSVALCYINEKFYFSDNYLAQDKIYYLQYNKCSGREIELKRKTTNAEKLPSFQEFEDSVLLTLQGKAVNKIIFDVRFNGGGSSAQGTQFLEKLSKYLKKNPQVKFYVIIGRNTFSSAILNAMDAKRLTKAAFVGEETAGKPNHFGEVRSFILPSSGIRVDYSTKYFKQTNENVNTIKPDVQKESSFIDFKTGIDPAYDWIRKQ